MHFNYPWAVNKTKLAQSVKALEAAKKMNPAVEITEASVKEEYVKRAGLLAAEEAEGMEEVADEPVRKPVRKPKEE